MSTQTEEPFVRPPREEVVRQNMGLVHTCAHRYKGRGVEYEDLVQAGCIGLIKAADLFDYSRGLRFSTYAVCLILGEIRRLFRDGGAVKVSRPLKELSLKVSRLRDDFAARKGRQPTVSELAKALGVGEEQIVEALSVAAPPLSLTQDADAGGGQLDLPVESHEERLSDRIALSQAIARLEGRDRALILLRYFGGKTQTETAARLGMTQVQVSRREKKILQALREELLG